MITGEKLKEELRKGLQQKTLEAVHEQNGQRELISARSDDESLNFEGRFWWLSGWTQCPTHTVAGMLLSTRLYACLKRIRIQRVR